MLTNKQLNQKIAGVKKATAALRENVHEILVNAAGHAYAHGDVTAYTRLFDAMNGADRHAVARWVDEFGFAKLDSNGAFKLNKAMRKREDFGGYNEEGGQAVVAYLTDSADPWYAFVKPKESVASDLDMEKQIQNLIKRTKKAIEEGERNVVVPFGTRKAIAELADLSDAIRSDRDAYNAQGGEPGENTKDVTPAEPVAIAAE